MLLNTVILKSKVLNCSYPDLIVFVFNYTQGYVYGGRENPKFHTNYE